MQTTERVMLDRDDATTAEFSEGVSDYLSAAAGTAEGAEREAGLLITPTGIRAIRDYVTTALALRTDKAEVVKWLGYDQEDTPGLTAADIAALYLTIKTNAQRWSGLESGMRNVGSDLSVFSANLIISVGLLIETIKGLASYKNLTATVGDLTLEEIAQLPKVALAEGDDKNIPVLLALINDLKRLVTRHRESTARVHADITAFKVELDVVVTAELTNKLVLLRSDNSQATMLEMEAKIDRLKEQIEEKTREYNSYQKKKWIGIFSPVALYITQTIFGSNANGVSKEREALLAEKQELDKQIQRLDVLVGGFEILKTSLLSISLEVNNALAGAENLESMWSLLETLVKSSYDQIDGINNATMLLVLVGRLGTLKNNWKSVQKSADDLLVAFDRAIKLSK